MTINFLVGCIFLASFGLGGDSRTFDVSYPRERHRSEKSAADVLFPLAESANRRSAKDESPEKRLAGILSCQ